MDFSSLPYELQFSYLLGLPYQDITSYCTSSSAALTICLDDEFWKLKVDLEFGLIDGKPEKVTYRQQYLDFLNPPFLEEAIRQRRLDLVIMNITQWNFPRAKEAQLADELGYTEIRDYLISRGVVYYPNQKFSISEDLDNVRFTIEQLPEGTYTIRHLYHAFKLKPASIKLMLNRYMIPDDSSRMGEVRPGTELILSRPGPRITFQNRVPDEERMTIKNHRCFKLFTDLTKDLQESKIINYQLTQDQSGVSPGLTRLIVQLKDSGVCETIARLVPGTDKIYPPW